MGEATEAGSEGARPLNHTSGSTRGFLFADLRGYSQFVEAKGASAASRLLERYRSMARSAIARFDGAEIKTEGDSFFVVFSSVSNAVRCGLALVADAKVESDPELPIRVGVGIHAGETVETGDSYIGSGVNIAARICAQAHPSEVLVSETVRALTRNVLPVGFAPRGRPQLKGITERISLYAVTEVPAAATGGLLRRKRVIALGAIAFGALAVLALGGLWAISRKSPGLPPGDWKIGLVTTQTGFETAGLDELFDQVINASTLAIDDVNANGGIHGRSLALTVLDDQYDEMLPAQLTQTLVDDPSVLAMIGPYASGQAMHAVPISNGAGLLHCSPTNTDPALTKPRYGALDLRGADPERVSFVRIAPSDDIQSKAQATFAYVDLNAREVLVVDDGDLGRQLADLFAHEFEVLGGTVTRRTLNEDADATALVGPILNGSQPPDVVFFSGATWSGGPEVRQGMAAAGHADVPYLGWDPILDGSGENEETYIAKVGAALAEGSFASQAALPDAKFSFVDSYRERFGLEPGQYAAGAYACMQVLIESLRETAFQEMTSAQIREAARQYAVDPNRQYETVVGNIGFDQNGDNDRQFVAIYRVDPSAADGAGDWVLVKKQDYGPAP